LFRQRHAVAADEENPALYQGMTSVMPIASAIDCPL